MKRDTLKHRTCEAIRRGARNWDIFVCAAAALYVTSQLAQVMIVPPSIALTYVCLVAIIPPTLGHFLYRNHALWVQQRRTVDEAELRDLYAEVDRYGEDEERSTRDSRGLANQAESERKQLQSLPQVLELDALPLRKSLVALYRPTEELIARTRRELELLAEYTDDDPTFNRLGEVIDALEETISGSTESGEDEGRIEKLQKRLRAELGTLRETVAWFDKTWSIGERWRIAVTYWASVTFLAFTAAGTLPVVHAEGNGVLTILHWGILGVAGGMLSTLLELHNLDVPEVGETAGQELLHATIRRVAIGAASSVLLYAALWGEALDGQIFPDVDVISRQTETSVAMNSETDATVQITPPGRNVGLSIFWGLMAGLSPLILYRLTQVAESSLGQTKGTGE